MEQTRYEPPLFIEELCFQVPAHLVERYLELEQEIFAVPLARQPGFMGAQAWVSADHPGEVTSLYLWREEADYHGLDQAWLQQAKQAMAQAMGEGNLQFLRAGHVGNRRFLAREYR